MQHIRIFESASEKLYHGNRKGDFPPSKKRFADAIFLTSSLDFAKDFAGFNDGDEFPDGAVWEVELKELLNLCNPMETKTMIELNLKEVIQKMIDDKYVDEASGTKFNEVGGSGFKGYDPHEDREFDLKDKSESVYFYLWRIKNGAWRIIECNPVIERIKESGYDGFYIVERGAKNVAIFDEKSMKSFEKILDHKELTPDKISESHLYAGSRSGSMRHIKKFESLFRDNTNENESWTGDLYDGNITFEFSYKELGLDKLTEEFYKKSGIPREYILNELIHFIEMDAEGDDLTDYIADYQKDRLGLIRSNWDSLDSEEQREFTVKDRFRRRLI